MSIDQQGNANATPEGGKKQEHYSDDQRSSVITENNAVASDSPANEPSYQRNNSEHAENEKALVRWTKVVAFLTGGLIVVGAITGYIFYRQLNVMQGQLSQMTDDSRPWVKPTAMEITEFGIDENQISIMAKFSYINV